MTKDQSLTVPSELALQVKQEGEKRQILAKYVSDNMKQGTDFYTLRIGGRESKPSLSKPGSEKVLSLFHWRAEFVRDTDTWEMLGSPAGVLCYLCKLYTIKDGILVGEGRGARDSKKDGNDLNKAIKMAEKSAQIDAVLRTGGLSDLFTQDIEDLESDESPKMAPYRVEKVIHEDEIEEGQILTRGEIKAIKEPRDDAPKTVGAQKAKIVALLIKLGHPAKTKKDCEDAVFDLTDLTLSKENYATIIDRLQILADEMNEKYGK